MRYDLVTTESLRKKFKNNFDLCNFAIHVGRNEIMKNPQTTLSDILIAVDEGASEAQSSLYQKG